MSDENVENIEAVIEDLKQLIEENDTSQKIDPKFEMGEAFDVIERIKKDGRRENVLVILEYDLVNGTASVADTVIMDSKHGAMVFNRQKDAFKRLNKI